tara:strand:+ start:683 stop:937 length:255 start_codon:yes stop_codon:yes gene_type:complete
MTTKKQSKSLDTRIKNYKKESKKRTISDNSELKSVKSKIETSNTQKKRKLISNEFTNFTTAIRLDDDSMSHSSWRIIQGLNYES